MPQNFSLYPDLSVQENLDFFADINGVARADKNRRIDEMLTFINLADFRQRKAGHLSGGMKKKLALACALVHAPQVLLLDEPSTGVDPVSRRELWVLLSDVVQNGVTVLVSTPYMDEAERCHEVGILFDGHLLASGKPEALINQLPFSIVEVKASPRKAIRQIVSELAGISAWRPVGDRLRLSVLGKNGAAAHVMEDLQTRMAAQSLDVKLLREARGSMEDVFIHRVEDHQAVS
jgi:ABC-2 type transport system ATP-binding protein